MKHFITILFCSVIVLSFGQTNLVPNPSFEIRSGCPDGASSFVQTELTKAIGWYQPNEGTSDLFCECSTDSYSSVPQNFNGYQYARIGECYSGILTSYVDFGGNDLDYREYIAVKLSDSLSIGTRYYVSFYVSLGDSINYTTDQLGVCFQTDSNFYATQDFIPLVPQISNPNGNFITDKLNWTLISSSFIADSSYQYLLLGNFKSGANTPRQFVAGGGSSAPIEYEQTFLFLDDICVSTDSLTCHQELSILNSVKPELRVFPNPCSERVFVDLADNLKIKYQIINIQGEVVLVGDQFSKEGIDISFLNSGMYFIQLEYLDFRYTEKLFVE